jgi:D-beta-D-heptose 7-phosphate kinase/D-beta-D-heptose 1-phosphate adenosyltransferase
MKHLFFLYGEKRSFETARKFWNILDMPNVDIVIHTPNTTSDYIGSQDFETVSEKDFDILGAPKVFLYDRDEYKKTDNHVPHFSWRFLSEYLNNSDEIYDLIFVGRLDSTFIINEWDRLSSADKNVFYPLLETVGQSFAPDHAFFGSYNIIKKFVNNLPETDYWNIDGDPHTNFCKYVGDNFKEKIWEGGFYSQHIRYNMIPYFEKNVNEPYNKFINEFNKLHHDKLDIQYKSNYREDWMKNWKQQNIAILTYGEYRTADTAVSTWNILESQHNIDVYVHTQNKSDDTEISKEDIENLFHKVNNCNIYLEDRDAYSYDKEPRDIHLNFRSYRFLFKKLLESNKEYDFIIVNRLDSTLYIHDIEEFLQSYDSNTLFTLNKNITFENPFIQDHFFMGDSDVVSSFLENLPPPENLRGSHEDFGRYILSTKYKNEQLDKLICFHLRPNQINYIKNVNFSGLYEDNKNYRLQNFNEEVSSLESEYGDYTKSQTVLIIGESCTDIFIYGEVDRLSPEAPIPIIKPTKSVTNSGMAGNVFENMKSLGLKPKLITNSTDIKKIRYVDESYNYILLRIDENDNVEKLKNLPDVSKFDIVVFVDYNKGFLSEDVIKELSKLSKLSFIDTKKKLGDWCKEIDFIKINYNEYLNSKEFIDNNDWIREKVIITRGPYGCDYNGTNYPTKDVGVKDVAGAGDSFLSGLIFKYIQTNSIENSIQFANRCSTQVVQQKGVSIINKNLL